MQERLTRLHCLLRALCVRALAAQMKQMNESGRSQVRMPGRGQLASSSSQKSCLAPLRLRIHCLISPANREPVQNAGSETKPQTMMKRARWHFDEETMA